MTLHQIETALRAYANSGNPGQEVPALAALVEVHKTKALIEITKGRSAFTVQGTGRSGVLLTHEVKR